ncbi:hypothetical protein SOCEGT47_039470 [Sorangium cellulosum]|uniref:Uncharacterized protein n=1 Tax=Sorangium cellulosum TaxID=56 RepID=A0A4V0NDP8_SORCE|nr:DUF6345 domain-containing protein [Sorangium cellulosum]AUX23422.1 hypothetical protein SOCEGT47_039470 [Sorangium cellulosum]
MKRSPVEVFGIFFLVASGATACSGGHAREDPQESADRRVSGTGGDRSPLAREASFLPSYRVIGRSADAGRAAALAGALGLAREGFRGGAALAPDGAIRYLDRARFQRLPTRKVAPPAPGFRDERGFATVAGDDAVDFEALSAIRVLPEQDAAARAWAALEAARLPVGRDIAVGHSVFESIDAAGLRGARAELDTQVSFRDELEGLRLIGPGAKVRITFDAEGAVTHLIYARRELERGEDVAIVPASEAPALCARALGGGAEIAAEPELVYYAPPLSREVTRILPHYICSARRFSGGEVVDVRRAVVPAVKDAPRAAVAVRMDGETVTAEAIVAGGAAPYTYRWVSSARSLDGADPLAAEVRYPMALPDSGPLVRGQTETLSLYVTDANGLVATASRTIPVLRAAPGGEAPRAPVPAPDEDGRGVVGAEWVGRCGGLDHSAANVDGLLKRFEAGGVTPRFNWGDQRAWEIDFKDPVMGGQDASFVDSVDLTFYTGHANGSGFMFCSNMSDRFLHFGDAHWGNSNLEWMVVAACGPLQDDAGAWRFRWSGAFNGLHLLLGYATISYDDTTEGALFAGRLLDEASPAPLRQAWATTAIEVQPDDKVIYAVMGVYGPGWTIPNYDDHFWGKGPVGPDLRGAARIGFWRISGPT